MADQRVITLEAARTDGWFDKLAQSAPDFDQLCEIVGERFVAFAVIAGVRISTITIDRRSPDASLVDFTVGEDEDHRLPLGEFRRRLAATLLADEPYPSDVPAEPDTESIQAFIGFRFVLLAPVFGVRLLELRLGPGHAATLSFRAAGREEAMPLEHFRNLIRDAIRAELQRFRTSSPFAIDFDAIPSAEEAAAKEDWDGVIEILGAWPGPLSLLLRTAEGQALTPDARSSIARSLGILGTAYVRSGRHEWGEEVMRLGIQWGQDRPASGDLFRRLGQSLLERDCPGQAIGVLRRSLQLGTRPKEVLPLLARSYAARERYVAAMVCAEEAMATGAQSEELTAVIDAATKALGDAWVHFRENVPMSQGGAETLPPPPGPGATGD